MTTTERTPFDPPDPSGMLAGFVADSPTPWHAAARSAERLAAAGFSSVDPGHRSGEVPECGFVVRDGSLVAWWWPQGGDTGDLRIIGAHTDSPGLRVRPRPDTGRAGFRQLGVEVYGSALLNSWLDRDLGLAGRVVTVEPEALGGLRVVSFHHAEPLLRIPQLAVHLDREVNQVGLKLNPQEHLTAVWGLGSPVEGELREWLAAEVGVDTASILGYDVACVDTQPPVGLGTRGELLAAPRLDDLACCFVALEALVAASGEPGACVVVLYDHEEVGSTSATGAAGVWLSGVLERVAAARGSDRAALLGMLAGSHMLSADMAHGTHPNYPERHEPSHWVRLGGGPVVKHNVNQRYATASTGAALFRRACGAAGVAVQDYSNRGDLPCGSTIGPLAAAGLAVDTVDVGMAMLSMHSCRELMAGSDVADTAEAFAAWLMRT